MLTFNNVKAVISGNKKLILISFATLIQTLKADPEIVNLIQNIPRANDSKQHKDNDNNSITKYLESNKHNILDLAEKHYENIVEAMTNNAVNSAVASSSPTLTLQQSSSIFLGALNQSDPYNEEPQIYRNSEVDIAD